MPLLIPPPRNLTREGLAAFVYALQMSRVEEERRKRAEEAADAGGGALGGGLGGAAGAVVGGLIGGPAGAMIGMGIGQAGGTAIGAAIEPPGRGYPGGAAGVVGRGLQAGTQQAVQGFALREQLTQRREPGTPEALGIRRADVNAWLQSPAAEALKAEGLTGQPLRLRGRQELARQVFSIEAARQQQIYAGRTKGMEAGEAQARRAQAYLANPDAFEHTQVQAETLEQLRREREELEKMLFNPAAEVLEVQGLLSGVRRKMEALGQRVTPKPQRPVTYEQLKASGQPGRPGVGYVETNPITGNPMGTHAWTERGTWTFMPSGERFEFPDEPGVKYFYNAKHEPELVPQPKDPPIDRTSMMTPAQIQTAAQKAADALEYVPLLDDQGKPVLDKTGQPKERRATEAEKEAAAKAAPKGLQDTSRSLQRRGIVMDSETTRELFAKISEADPGFAAARQIIERPYQVPAEVLEKAAKHVVLTVRDWVNETADQTGKLNIPRTLAEGLKQWDADLARTVAERRRSIPIPVEPQQPLIEQPGFRR